MFFLDKCRGNSGIDYMEKNYRLKAPEFIQKPNCYYEINHGGTTNNQ